MRQNLKILEKNLWFGNFKHLFKLFITLMLTNVFLHMKIIKNYIKILKNQKWTFINVQNPKKLSNYFLQKSELLL